MEDMFQEQKEPFSHFSNINIKCKFEMQTDDLNSSERHIDTPHLCDVPMNIDSKKISVRGGPTSIESDMDVSRERIDSNMQDDNQFEDQDINEEDNGVQDRDGDEDGDEDEDEDDQIDEKLIISQDGSNYVASSKVDDYKYRPQYTVLHHCIIG